MKVERSIFRLLEFGNASTYIKIWVRRSVAAAAAAAAGYNACPGSNPLTITCPGGELIRSPNPHSDDHDLRSRFTISPRPPQIYQTQICLFANFEICLRPDSCS